MIRLARLLISFTFAMLGVFLVVQFLAADHTSSVTAPGSDLVQTTWGPVRGFQSGETYAFLGIPYAAPPLGELRWQPPADPQPWTDELSATAFPPACPQWNDEETAVIGREDCLYLNVWTPITATPGADLPVLVFIHGGGNVKGHTAKEVNGARLYDGRYLSARNDVVVVTLQYRLGALGFLVHPDLIAESDYGGAGNYGLMDQIQALTWVQDNITAFGGDPAQVLLFGESGGAENTCMLLASPLAEGLFSRALMQSGGCVAKTAAERAAEGTAFAAAAACGEAADTLLCLRQTLTTTLVTAIDTTPIISGVVSQTFGSNVDGYVLPHSPLVALALGAHNHVPFVIGSNADEMLPLAPPLTENAYILLVHAMLNPFRPGAGSEALALYAVGDEPGAYPTARQAYAALVTDGQFTCPARRITRLAARSQTEPVYRYFFSQSLSAFPYNLMGAFHGLELFFVFQQMENITDYAPTAEDLALQAAMGDYWTQFAASGDPTSHDRASWPIYDAGEESYLELGAPLITGTHLRAEKCDFWDSIARPHLGLAMEASATAVAPGDLLTYTITLANGGGLADGVVLSSTLDGRTHFVRASAGGVNENGAVTWALDSFSSTRRSAYNLTVRVGEAPTGAQLTSTAWVTSTQGASATTAVTVTVSDTAPNYPAYLPVITNN